MQPLPNFVNFRSVRRTIDARCRHLHSRFDVVNESIRGKMQPASDTAPASREDSCDMCRRGLNLVDMPLFQRPPLLLEDRLGTNLLSKEHTKEEGL